MLNPAIAGIENYVDIQVGFRNQWNGVDGAPTTGYISWHQPISKSGKVPGFTFTEEGKGSRMPKTLKHHPHHGIGANLIVDNVGVFSNQELSATYALHIPIASGLNASLGFSPGLLIQGLNNSRLSNAVLTDPAIAGFDTRFSGLLKLGGWIYAKHLYAGGAFHSSFDQNQDIETRYFINAGGMFGNKIMRFKPYTVVRRVNDDWTYDVGMQGMWQSRIWGGASWRSVSELVYYVGANITSSLSATFLYNDPLQNSYISTSSTQEIVIQFRIGNRAKVLCPQLLW